MASFFTIGEKKIRPGNYFRYENIGASPVAGADDGKCAAVFRSNWGQIGQAVLLESPEDIAKVYGTGGADGTTAIPMEQFKGGANSVYAVRLGAGGTNGTYAICDTDSIPVIQLTAKFPGSRALSVTIRPTLDEPGIAELIVLDGTTELERRKFTNVDGDDNIQSLMNAFQAQGSNYYTLTLLAESTNAIATVDQAAVTGGTDPTITFADYTSAFEILEAYRWNVLSIDTEEPAIQLLMQGYLDRIYRGGQFVMGVVGESSTVLFETRLAHASAYNDYKMVYVGNGFLDIAGNVCEGSLAAARISGLIASTPSSASITHLAVTGATDLSETFTNGQIERALTSGMLVFSTNAQNAVWVEQGINTLVTLGKNDDAGWKKIKRVKVRFELFSRLNDSTDMLSGQINNDQDGRMTVVQIGNGVCKTMVAERKLLSGAHIEIDPENRPEGDSAWFVVYADDTDALEKLYYTFRFRFAPEE